MNTPKRVHLLLCWQLLLAQMSMAQSTGFVSLEGRQFMLDGQEFYPIVMNYSVLLMRDLSVIGTPTAAEIYFGPDASFGPTSSFDCTNEGGCSQRLLTDFLKVKDMGFNAVRVVKAFESEYRDTPEHGTNERRFSMDLYQNQFPNNDHDSPRMKVDMEEGMNGPYATRYFELINDMLDVAEAADLKVILLTGGASPMSATRRHMYPTFDQDAVDDYAEYLAALAEAVKDHPALLAYDLFNEPQFNTLEYQELGDPHNNQSAKWKKQDICDFTTAWYDAINAHDPNHLVTLGGLGDYELEVWDPAVLHIDFYSLHIYPWKDYLGQWDPAQSMEYFQAKLHWFGQTCPMPWIIGETGWSANDDVIPPHTGPYPTYHEWPFTQGLEVDQAAFTASCLELTRQCGGSGWSWWYFQEFRWWDFYYDINDPDGPAYEQINLDNGESLMLGIYYAMLKPGDGNQDYYEKPAVDEVRNFILDPMPDPPGAEPANYYNWDNLSGGVTYSGAIVEEDGGQPIKDAQAWLRMRHIDDPNHPALNVAFETFHVAVTDASGEFSIKVVPTVAGYVAPIRNNLILAAVGASTACYGAWCPGPVPSSGTTFPLDRNAFEFDGRVENLTVASTTGVDNLRYEAWDDLEVDGVTVTNAPDPGATEVEFAARQSVHVRGEFHVEEGSEVHLFLEETFPDCDGDSYRIMEQEQGVGIANDALARKEGHQQIQLKFGLPGVNKISVSPNPFTNDLHVWWGTNSAARLQLTDAFGRALLTRTMRGPGASLELGYLAAGPYLLRVVCDGEVNTHSLIKQP